MHFCSKRVFENGPVALMTIQFYIIGATVYKPREMNVVDPLTRKVTVAGSLDVGLTAFAPITVGDTVFAFGGISGSALNTWRYLSNATLSVHIVVAPKTLLWLEIMEYIECMPRRAIPRLNLQSNLPISRRLILRLIPRLMHPPIRRLTRRLNRRWFRPLI